MTGYVRQGAFKGLRTDKQAADVVRETARTAEAPPTAERRAERVTIDKDDHGTIEMAGVRVTHPDADVCRRAGTSPSRSSSTITSASPT